MTEPAHSTMRVLLVEPYYPRSEPPLGLMKLSTWHKEKGREVKFIRGTDPFGTLGDWQPDAIDITTPIFSWNTDEGIQTIRFYLEKYPDAHVRVGGVKATDTPEAYSIGRVELIRGILPDVDECKPDYSMINPPLERSVIYTMRGCPVGCGFCRVWRESGKVAYPLKNWQNHIDYSKKRLIIQDDNIVAAGLDHLTNVCSLIRENDFSVDFNSGFEVHQFNEDHAKILHGLKIRPVRTAFDEISEESEFLQTMKLIREHITDNSHAIMCYVLFNFTDTPEDALYRCNKVVEAGGSPYVMPFTPNTWIKGDIHHGQPFINKHWTLKQIKRFYRFWNRYWIWRSVQKKQGVIREEDVWN